jgi:lantibiotic modifying enzyme
LLQEFGYPEKALKAYQQAAMHPDLYKGANLYAGSAGFGLSSLYFWQQTAQQGFLDQACVVGDLLIQTAQKTERGYAWPETGQMLGYALGSSGIALFFLYLYQATQNPTYLQAGQQALAFDISYGSEQFEAGVLSFPEHTQSLAMVSPYWFNGTAGVATAVLRYWQVTKHQPYKNLLDRMALDTLRRHTLQPGLFTGLAGLGNFLLDAHKATGEAQYQEGLAKIISGILPFKIEKESGVAFPGELLLRISTDMGSGSAGIGLFFMRWLEGSENFNFTLDGFLVPKPRVLVKG